MNPLRAATLSVSDMPLAVARYREWLDYRVIEAGRLDAGVATSLGAPAANGSDYAILRPASGRAIDLRLIETSAVSGFRSLRTYGWAAIELCVEDVHAVHARLQGGPFDIIGPPSPIAGLPTIHPMQVEGPDGEIVFLTEIKQGGAGSGLPTAAAPVDTLFIAVLACRDMPAMAQWTAEQLGVRIGAEIEIAYRTISRAFGFPTDRLHRIATATHEGEIFLEFDQYPVEATERPHRPGSLMPGVAAVTVLHDRLDAIPGPWATAPTPREGAIYEGRRVGVLRAPEGALIEIVESVAP